MSVAMTVDDNDAPCDVDDSELAMIPLVVAQPWWPVVGRIGGYDGMGGEEYTHTHTHTHEWMDEKMGGKFS